MGIILAILLFSVVIIFHELGHFSLAKFNKIRVDEFSLGLGPTIIGKQIGATKFSLKLLPFGGACMMGEDDTDDVTDGSFNSKSVWARMSVIVAGPVFNFIMALVFSIIIVGWIGYRAPVITGVDTGYSAMEQGMQAGDVITEMNGKRVHLWDEVTLANLTSQDADSVSVTYERDGQEHTVLVEPRQLDDDVNKRLGIQASGEYAKGGVIETVKYGFYTVRYWVNYTFTSLKMLVTGQVGIKQMSGPVGIVNVVDDIYQESAPGGWQIVMINLLNIATLLSANLGVLNLLPLPALDGGRLVFLIVEAVRGRRVPPEKEGMVHFAGLALLLVLMAVVMFNDIRNLFV